MNVGEYAFGYTGANCEKVKEFQIEAANKTAGCIYAINNGFKKHDKHNFLLLSYDAPNCEEEGVKEYECSVCGEHFEENIPKTEHDYVEQFVRRQSTKLREGMIEYVCSKCGDSIEDQKMKSDYSSRVSMASFAKIVLSRLMKLYSLQGS